MLRLLRRILLVGLAACVGLAGVLAALAWFFQDEVKARLVAELNAHLTAPLHQSGIELTLIRRFPEASLRIRDAWMQEVRTDGRPADTLLYARDLYLEFSLPSLLRGEQTVRQLHGTGVVLRPGFDANGQGNWNVWRSDTTATRGQGSGIDLRRVTFDGLRGRFHDARSGLEVAVTSNQLGLGGRFREEGSTLTAKGDLALLHWRNANGTMLTDRKAEVDLAMAFGGVSGAFQVHKGELVFGKTPVQFSLEVVPGEQGSHMDLRANGFGLDLASVVQLLPDGLRASLRRYGMDGSADLAVHYGGPLEGAGPALSMGLKLHDGRFTERASGTVFKDVKGEFSARFTPAWAPAELVARNFSASSPSGPLGGNLTLSGLKNAKLNMDLHGRLHLADLLHFAGMDTLEQVTGSMQAQAHVQGRLRDVEDIRPADLRALAITGSVKLKDAGLKVKGLRHRVTELNAELALEGNDALVHGLRCRLQGNAMELSGALRNLVPYALFKDQRLRIEATGRSPMIDLATLMEAGPGQGQAPAQGYAFTLPAMIDMDLAAEIGELRMERFRATEVQGKLRITGQRLTMSPLRFHTAEGTVAGSLELDARPASAYPLSIQADLRGINVSALFAEFRDFGQRFITAAHVKGTGDARLVFTAPLRPDLSLDQPKLHCVADVTLVNGELNDHASLIAVADHMESNKLIAPFVDIEALRKELRHVTFKKLENRIEIKDRKVYLPQMAVSSSVMDLEVSGTHGFDGEVDDHLNFRLGDLLRNGRESEDGYGPVLDDGTGLRIFLHMYGTTSDLQFGNDGAMAAAKRKERMQQESAQLKGILKGIVSGQKTMASAPEAAQQGRIAVEFGDGQAQPPPPTPKPKKGLGRLLQKDEKEQPQVVIGVE
jgi:uncharacterized protein involved in outer membrane biogenesis